MADVSVRPARAADVPEIARIQVGTWRAAYAELLPAAVLAEATEEVAAARWSAAITAPPSPAHRVLVAQEQDQVVGFAAFGPAEPAGADDDPAGGEIYALLVEPRWGRRGHGSRLLAAVVDHLREGGIDRALAWVADGDAASTRFYRSAGWEPDGYARTLEDAGRTLRESRLHASLLEGELAEGDES
ncbi:MAG TPA: GNAT family N-acetyltransferase [Mycobacteriales bacterium]|nr:GNAT family N-acetyltransferase [Mycobacteriales bacterium]